MIPFFTFTLMHSMATHLWRNFTQPHQGYTLLQLVPFTAQPILQMQILTSDPCIGTSGLETRGWHCGSSPTHRHARTHRARPSTMVKGEDNFQLGHADSCSQPDLLCSVTSTATLPGHTKAARGTCHSLLDTYSEALRSESRHRPRGPCRQFSAETAGVKTPSHKVKSKSKIYLKARIPLLS